MAMKDWFRRLQPLPLYIILTATIVYFLAQMFVSYLTHALTLLVSSYHMLCNIIALVGIIVTLKHSQSETNAERRTGNNTGGNSVSSSGEDLTTNPAGSDGIATDRATSRARTSHSSNQERRLKNTFGWARIDVVMLLIVCVFLASLCFSLLMEAALTLIHIDHQDPMHHPIPVLFVGALGLILNALCYLVIGGYTFHQGSMLQVTDAGDVVLDRVMSGDSVKKGERRLSRTRRPHIPHHAVQRQGLWEMSRDVVSSIFVIICSLIVYFTDEHVAKFVDPVLSIISCICLLTLSYPYMKESGLILLQTIPGSIDIDSLKTSLLEAFPDIINVHDLHIWQLTASKIVSTAHIIFQDPSEYIRITEDVLGFFHEQGITQVTIQPEFYRGSCSRSRTECLMQCPGQSCVKRHCCKDSQGGSANELNGVEVIQPRQRNNSNIKGSSVSLYSVKIVDNAEEGSKNILKTSRSESSMVPVTTKAQVTPVTTAADIEKEYGEKIEEKTTEKQETIPTVTEATIEI